MLRFYFALFAVSRTVIYIVAASLLGLAASTIARAQGWEEGDSTRMAWLEANGVALERPHVVIYFPPDSASAEWMSGLADTLDIGVALLRKAIGAPLPWQRYPEGPVRYYLSPERFVSHMNMRKGSVLISWTHVQDGVAPYLHEAGHVLLCPKPPYFYPEYGGTITLEEVFARGPIWLYEGLPDYLARLVKAEAGIPEGDIFEVGDFREVDGRCAERLRTAEGAAILPHVGRGSFPIEMRRNRALYARPFYACSFSFTKFLVEQVGLGAMLNAIVSEDAHLSIGTAAGSSTEVLRQRWLVKIGYRVLE